MKTRVLDHGSIELLDSMGGDLDIVNGARTSFDEQSLYHESICQLVTDGSGECSCEAQYNRIAQLDHRVSLAKKDAGLINFLMREKHTSPFELVAVKFGVTLPIFVAREWMRHRTQSFNEMSGRYVQLSRSYYVPARDSIREQKGKAGAYYYERIEDNVKAGVCQTSIRASSEQAFDRYEDMLKHGIAKEVARLVLPVNTFTKFVASANLLNWMRFLSLRNHPQAQMEIRVYAEAIEKMLEQVAPVAMESFVNHGRLQ